jgi:hypothetical protein
MKIINQQIKGVAFMKLNKFATDFGIAFLVIFVVGMIITFLYNLLVYRTSMIDGESSFRLALILGLSRSIFRQLEKK